MRVSPGRREEIIAKVVRVVESFLDSPAAEGEEERLYTSEHRSLDYGRQVANVLLQAEVDAQGTGHCGQWHEDTAGVRRKFNRYVPKTVQTLVGPITVQRALYHRTGASPAGVCPLDGRLGLTRGTYSRGMEEVIALAGTCDVYRPALKLVNRLTGAQVSVQKAETTVAAWGAAAKAKVQAAHRAPQTAVERIAATRPVPGRRRCVTTDGTTVQTTERWRDTKLIGVYAFDEKGRKVGPVAYAGTLHYQEAYPVLLWQLLERTGASRAETLVWLGDGAPWVWNQQAIVAPHAVAIVDFYHAADRLWKVGRALYNAAGQERAAKRWSQKWIKNLYCGKVSILLQELVRHVPRIGTPPPECAEDDPRSVLHAAQSYFAHNAGRMDYARYRRLGYPIGSGVIESACRHIVGLRMKRTATMAWTEANAEAMVQLRCLCASDEWDTFWGLGKLRRGPRIRAA